MPIIKKIRKYAPDTHVFLGYEEERLFEGRVLRIEKRDEYRNVSDTLDYSDWQTVEAVWALVWLGTHGVAPRITNHERVVTAVEVYSWDTDKVRELTIGEQYAWIDCSNVFGDRNLYTVHPEVDSFDMQLLHGGPAMVEGLPAWEAFHKARLARLAEEARKVAAERAAIEAAAKAKADAARAKREAKAAIAKAAAEAQLVHCPKKGATVTVAGFTGKVFWTGVSKYYGKWNARVGVKDAKGTVQWIDAAHWAA